MGELIHLVEVADILLALILAATIYLILKGNKEVTINPPSLPAIHVAAPDLSGVLANFLNEVKVTLSSVIPKPIELKLHDLLDHAILDSRGGLIGLRHASHPDLQKALDTPGLKVKYPDGRIDEGVQ